MKTLEVAFIGFCVTSLAMIVIAGGPSNALSILALSIICTFGGGLIFWIPLWLAVGYVFIAPFDRTTFLKRGETPDDSDDHDDLKEVKVRVTTHTHPALLQYIKRAKHAGMPETILINRLRTQGWNPDEIDEALRRDKKLAKKRPTLS